MEQGKNRYFVFTIKRNGRITSLCLDKESAGPDGGMAPDPAFAMRREALARYEALECAAEPLVRLVTAVHDGCLLLTGYHQDNASQWRRMGRLRGDGQERDPMANKKERALTRRQTTVETHLIHSLTQAGQQGISFKDLQAFLELAGRIDRGAPAPEDLMALERAMTAQPDLWRVIGDYAQHAADQMLNQTDASTAVRLAFLRGAEELRRATAGKDAPPLEAAVAEQIAVCWVRLRVSELWLTQALDSDDRTLVEFWDYRVSRAHARYMDALERLARMRKLAARTPQLVQINVGELPVHHGLSDTDERVQEAARRLSEAGNGIEQLPEDTGLVGDRGREGTGDGRSE